MPTLALVAFAAQSASGEEFISVNDLIDGGYVLSAAMHGGERGNEQTLFLQSGQSVFVCDVSISVSVDLQFQTLSCVELDVTEEPLSGAE
jgi:hypothetical protein